MGGLDGSEEGLFRDLADLMRILEPFRASWSALGASRASLKVLLAHSIRETFGGYLDVILESGINLWSVVQNY